MSAPELTWYGKVQALVAFENDRACFPSDPDGEFWWHPKVGDFYTIRRADLELYQIVEERGDKFWILLVSGNPNALDPKPMGPWPTGDAFRTEGFGDQRVPVGEWILELEVPS